MIIKSILNDIIEQAYPKSPLKRKFKQFYVDLQWGQQRMPKHNVHYSTERKEPPYAIQVFNLERDDQSVLLSCIHGLAHHIDFCNREETRHDYFFYEVYRDLIYAALDMGLLQKEDCMKDQTVTERERMSKILETYRKKPCDYQSQRKKVVVSGCFTMRETLRQRGYVYCGQNSTWEKVILLQDIPAECEFLNKIQVNYQVTNGNQTLLVRKPVYIVAKEGSFQKREQLKQEGFRFNGAAWYLRVSSPVVPQKELVRLGREYPEVHFSLEQTRPTRTSTEKKE